MPRIHRRLTARHEFHNDDWDEYLATGGGRLRFRWRPGRDSAGPKNNTELVECWNHRRDDFLVRWIATRPRSRPWAWWVLDAPEVRRKIGGGGDTKPSPDDRRYIKLVVPPRCGNWWVSETEPEPEFESELAYLERLDLLTTEERKDGVFDD